MKINFRNYLAAMLFLSAGASCLYAQSYKIVHTGITDFYSNTDIITAPQPGSPFFGQDACYQANMPSYTDNHDGTITDNVTGLMWQKDMGAKITYAQAFVKADTMTLGGYTDWRVPTIKELYSLILFTGHVNGYTSYKLFIDTNYFNQPLGDTSIGERTIDAQTWSATQYKGLTMSGDSTVFGVNFVDGRIKGYPKYQPGSRNTAPNSMYFRMVRGNTGYGKNNFVDNRDGTITDLATGLMWQKADDGIARDWQNALAYAETLDFAGYTDWRLPSAKELQSIVDYNRCPDFTNSPAIDSVFATTMINYPDGSPGQYPYFWTATSHHESSNPYSQGVYIAFGEAIGKMNGLIWDVHGAGAQRSDPKTGNPADYPQYMGPQGDERIVFNFARCVRYVVSPLSAEKGNTIPHEYKLEQNYPNPFNPSTVIRYSVPESNYISSNQKVSLKIYDTLGREVADLVNDYKAPGNYSVTFNAGGFASGIYFCRFTGANSTIVKKMILMK